MICPGMAHIGTIFRFNKKLWEIIESSNSEFTAKNKDSVTKIFKYKDYQDGWVDVENVWSPSQAYYINKPSL